VTKYFIESTDLYVLYWDFFWNLGIEFSPWYFEIHNNGAIIIDKIAANASAIEEHKRY